MRYRFVDKIIDMDVGKSIHCQYTWPENLEIFQDHFPDFPVVPGVLLTEMMGQSSALCIESDQPELGSAMLIQIRKATFHNWVKPGLLLDIYAEILSANPKLARIKAETKSEGKSMANVELLFSFADRNLLGIPDIDPVLAAYNT